jgi:carbon-monoxide dehydrogenase small subunit
VNQAIALVINGRRHELVLPPWRTLLEVLREDLRLTGTKYGCDLGECGACTVLVDGAPVLACLTLAVEVADRTVGTVEGLARDGSPDPLQSAFVECGAAQCGYCTSGILLTAAALLAAEPDPSGTRVREALAGNLCRCTGYAKIVEAVLLAAGRRRESEPPASAERAATPQPGAEVLEGV